MSVQKTGGGKRRKKGDWVAVAKGRTGKDRYPRESAACVWHCGRMIPTGGAALLAHLAFCKSRSK